MRSASFGALGPVFGRGNVPTGKTVRNLLDKDPIQTVAVEPAGSVAASASESQIQLWSARDGRLKRAFAPGFSRIQSIAMPDSKRLLIAGNDAIQLWDLMSERPIGRFGLICKSIHRCGREEAILERWGGFSLLSFTTGKATELSKADAERLLSEDTQHLRVTVKDDLVRVYAPLSARTLATIPSGSRVQCAAISHNGCLIYGDNLGNAHILWLENGDLQ